MPYPPRLVRVLAGNRAPGRCKFCRQAIDWALTARGNPIPLNPGAPLHHHERDETTGIRYDVLEPIASHFQTCTHKPAKRPRPSPARAAWAGGRH